MTGFGSSVTRNLSALQPASDAGVVAGSLHGSESGSGDSDAAVEGRLRRLLGGLGRGVLTAVSAPLVGAMHLVGRTTASLGLSVCIRAPLPSPF